MRVKSILLALLLMAPASANAPDPPAWTRPIAPFHLIGPIDYVGSEGIAAYLIHTRAGAILIDGTLEANADMVRRHIEAMGVPIRDVKWIIVSHAHFDHAGAAAALARASGASVAAGAGDVAALGHGMPPGETNYTPVPFPPVHVDRAIRNGDRLTLGGRALTAHATPGHTPGCTTWTMRVTDEGRPLAVIFPCSVTVAGNRLVGNKVYPGIVTDFRKSFATLGAMKADIVLPAHPEVADVVGRAKHGETGRSGATRAHRRGIAIRFRGGAQASVRHAIRGSGVPSLVVIVPIVRLLLSGAVTILRSEGMTTLSVRVGARKSVQGGSVRR